MDIYTSVYHELKNLYETVPEIFNLLYRHEEKAPYNESLMKLQLENKFLEKKQVK